MKKGFTLIEVMLSLCLIMFCMLAVSKLSILAVHSMSYGECLTHATVLGHSKLLFLRGLAPASTELEQQWHPDPQNPVRSDGMEFYRFWSVEDRPRGKEVTLYVAWHDRQQRRARNFGSLEELKASPCPRIDISEFLMKE